MNLEKQKKKFWFETIKWGIKRNPEGEKRICSDANVKHEILIVIRWSVIHQVNSAFIAEILSPICKHRAC